jgi:hypothetical protein
MVSYKKRMQEIWYWWGLKQEVTDSTLYEKSEAIPQKIMVWCTCMVQYLVGPIHLLDLKRMEINWGLRLFCSKLRLNMKGKDKEFVHTIWFILKQTIHFILILVLQVLKTKLPLDIINVIINPIACTF